MNAGSDFPQVRPSDWGNADYDEFYSNGLGSMSPDRIYKTKLSTQERFVWHEVGYYNSEVAVIENPEKEGECVIMLLATPFEVNELTPRAFLVILNGDNLNEIDRAYFPEQVRLPWMAHTTYIDMNVEEETTTTTTSTTTSTTTTTTTTESTTE